MPKTGKERKRKYDTLKKRDERMGRLNEAIAEYQRRQARQTRMLSYGLNTNQDVRDVLESITPKVSERRDATGQLFIDVGWPMTQKQQDVLEAYCEIEGVSVDTFKREVETHTLNNALPKYGYQVGYRDGRK